MVQRKALNKPSFKASPIHEENPSSTKMKPSIQILDTKTKGTDLATKMKKSRSFKRSSDLDTLKRPSLKRHQPSKQQQPPCSPMKQSPPRSCPSTSPNYMKSTSSSEARKEQKQVLTNTCTPKRLFTSPKSCSSLSKVRNLTKAPSFKPSRSIISKKCSKIDVKRNTCSSTMKDSKFPKYLDLSPGGNEYQGTSIVKVCPYNYCSLNGHRHAQAPPLKSFLATRRRIIKAQRTPCKVKPCLDDDKPNSPLLKEDKVEFFLEIYAKKEESVEECVYDVGSYDWESSTSISIDELFVESSNMEYEEEDDVSTPSDNENGHTKENEIVCLLDEEVLKKNDVSMEFLKEFLPKEEDVKFSQDEIVDCHEQSSDSDSSMDDLYEETELDQFIQGNCDDIVAENEEKTTEKTPEEFAVPDKTKEVENSGFEKELLSVVSINETIQETEIEDESNANNEPSGNVVRKNFKKERTEGELSDPCVSSLIITKGRRNGREEFEEVKSFNPREPNFLEVELDPESEKVDLKHQDMDERRNSEEWMVDYALRKAVNDLAPARKRKVALLVAAFETVIPPSRVQACN